MYFKAGEHAEYGLTFNPFKAIVAPRPIGWIGSYSDQRVANLAPYSFFNAICDAPPLVGFSSSGFKDSARNIANTGAFSCSIVSFELRDAMNASSAMVDGKTSEFDLAGLTPEQGKFVDAPIVGTAPAVLECVHVETKVLKAADGTVSDNHFVIGEVVGVHIDDRVVKNGQLDLELFQPLARLGYKEYCAVRETFELERPDVS